METDVTIQEPNLDEVVPEEVQDIPIEEAQQSDVPEVSEAGHEPVAPATGQDQSTAWMQRELKWMRSTVNNLSEANKRLQANLEEYETAGMDPEQVTARKLQRMEEELQSERARNAAQQWRDYCLGFGVAEEKLVGDDPVQWLHETLSDQQQKVTAAQEETAKLLKTVAALKKAQVTPDVPKVSSGTGKTATNQKTIWDYSLQEIERMADAAAFGQLDPADIPPLS